MPVLTSPVAGKTWVWQGHTIHYVQAGQSQAQRPPLLLIHGFGASTDHWKKNIAELQADFEVWAIDLLGFGRSAKPALQYSGDLWCDQLTQFIQQIIQKPVVVAGNSLGGYAALCVAAAAPEWVNGVVLLNSAGPFTETVVKAPPNAMQQAIRAVSTALLQSPLVSFLIFMNMRRRATVRKTLERVYFDPTTVTDELVEDILRPAFDPGAFQVFASVFKTPQGAKVDELLHQMRCPLLLIWGEADPWMKVRDRSPKFQQHYPQLTEHFIQAGHCPHDEAPEQVNNLMRDWVLQLSTNEPLAIA